MALMAHRSLTRDPHTRGRSALTSQWLFQLYLALECDLWIGTRNSNWNRLIDEMRCGSRRHAPQLI